MRINRMKIKTKIAKFITKNYEDILEKYKNLRKQLKLKLNPF